MTSLPIEATSNGHSPVTAQDLDTAATPHAVPVPMILRPRLAELAEALTRAKAELGGYFEAMLLGLKVAADVDWDLNTNTMMITPRVADAGTTAKPAA